MSAKKKRVSPKIHPAASENGATIRRWEGLVGEEGADRADRWIAETVGMLSRSQIKARNAHVFVADREVKLSRPLHAGESVRIEWAEEPPSTLVPEDIPLSVVYEDDRVFVIDKAQGMVTHPGHGNHRGTLANAALFLDAARRSGEKTAFSSPVRGGIVHRLDKDTSGIIIVARDAEAQAFLAAQFKDRKTKKEYIAITRGAPPEDRGRIENRLARDPRERKRFASVESGGKAATTEYRVLIRWGGAKVGNVGLERTEYALIALYPKTGRTHQLRVHMSGLGCAILGDPVYGKKDFQYPEATLMLHARGLKIVLPGAGEASLFKAKIPERFSRIVAQLDARYSRIQP